jgi:hypothetical protein
MGSPFMVLCKVGFEILKISICSDPVYKMIHDFTPLSRREICFRQSAMPKEAQVHLTVV